MKAYFIFSLFFQTTLFVFLIFFFAKNDFSLPWDFSEKNNQQNDDQEQSLSSSKQDKQEDSFYSRSLWSSNAPLKASDLLSSTDVTEIETSEANFSKARTGEGDITQSIKLHFPGTDKNLKLVDFKGEEFRNSQLRKALNHLKNIKVYVAVEFQKPITFKTLSSVRSLGFSPILGVPSSEYLRKKVAVFYVNYRRINNALRKDKSIKNIYLFTHFTATGLYQLDVKSVEEKKDISIDIRFPYTKPGRELIYKRNSFVGLDDIKSQTLDDYGNKVTLDLTASQTISFFSEVLYEVDLLKNVETHTIVQGEKLKLNDYKKMMQEKYSDIDKTFTGPSEKAVTSEYVQSIVKRLDKNQSISSIWRQIDEILDRDIRYDWKKRDLFFSGNLTYYNIKDMYMTAKELSEKKRGACTERTSLEIAILRELGISARSATRLFHIYTEVFIPNYGWTTTSLTLNEIPLVESSDENMAYFVSWTPDHPIRLKWGGHIYPSIIY